jgi:hypothetical protein
MRQTRRRERVVIVALRECRRCDGQERQCESVK